jgi:hypothetical protein
MWFSIILSTFKVLEISGSFKLEEVNFSSTPVAKNEATERLDLQTPSVIFSCTPNPVFHARHLKVHFF